MAIFDEDAPIYDHWFDMKGGKYADEAETAILLRLLGPQKNTRILDVGCGTGNISIKLAKMGCNVTGIDVSEAMLRRAKDKAGRLNLSIDFLKKDIYELDDENIFDGVCSNTAFEFLPDKERAVKIMLKAVKQNGNVVIGTIHKDSDWYDFYEAELRKANSFFSVFKHAAFLSENTMRQICPENLLSIETGLYLPPDIHESLISIENEREFKNKGGRGGYICGLWRK